MFNQSIRLRIAQSNIFTKIAFLVGSVTLIWAIATLTYTFSFSLTWDFAMGVFQNEISATALAAVIQVGALVVISIAALYKDNRGVFITLVVAAGAINVIDLFTNIAEIMQMPPPQNSDIGWAIVATRYLVGTLLVFGEELIMVLTTGLLFGITLIAGHFGYELPRFLRIEGVEDNDQRRGSNSGNRNRKRNKRKRSNRRQEEPARNRVPQHNPRRATDDVDERAMDEFERFFADLERRNSQSNRQ